MLDNHVVRYTPPEEYVKTLRGEKMFRNKNPLGCLVVGAESMNPEKVSEHFHFGFDLDFIGWVYFRVN